MSPVEFIEKNIHDELIKLGHTQYVASNCPRQAVRNWSRSTGAKGRMFSELFGKAKKQASMMKKALK
jgi:hypothetical protein